MSLLSVPWQTGESFLFPRPPARGRAGVAPHGLAVSQDYLSLRLVRSAFEVDEVKDRRRLTERLEHLPD
jgi:hypothetical protein